MRIVVLKSKRGSLTIGCRGPSFPCSPCGGRAGSAARLNAAATHRKVFVNVTVENLAPCKKLVRVEIESQQVDALFEEITRDFQRHAAVPGFRPGKVPRDMVTRLFDKDIRDEGRRALISDSYKKAMDEQNLEVLGQPDIHEIPFNPVQPLQFAATVE